MMTLDSPKPTERRPTTTVPPQSATPSSTRLVSETPPDAGMTSPPHRTAVPTPPRSFPAKPASSPPHDSPRTPPDSTPTLRVTLSPPPGFDVIRPSSPLPECAVANRTLCDTMSRAMTPRRLSAAPPPGFAPLCPPGFEAQTDEPDRKRRTRATPTLTPPTCPPDTTPESTEAPRRPIPTPIAAVPEHRSSALPHETPPKCRKLATLGRRTVKSRLSSLHPPVAMQVDATTPGRPTVPPPNVTVTRTSTPVTRLSRRAAKRPPVGEAEPGRAERRPRLLPACHEPPDLGRRRPCRPAPWPPPRYHTQQPPQPQLTQIWGSGQLVGHHPQGSGGMNGLKEGWFSELNDLWPGVSLSLEVDKVLHSERSEFQDILVLETKSHGRALVLDGIIQCTEHDEFAYQEMISFLPLCSHPDPKKVLIVGGGDGGVAREVAKHPAVESITQVEIDGRVVDLSKRWLPFMGVGFSSPKLTLHVADGFEFMARHQQEFDVIITDSSDPVGPAVALFEQSYFKLMSSALRPGGIVCSQGGTVWSNLDQVCDHMDHCRSTFPRTALAWASVPTYPSGMIGFVLGSLNPKTNFKEPLRIFTNDELEKMNLRYYSSEIHRASFVLPRFAEKVLFPASTLK
ncbi:uncharacterized protein LOC134527697 [Bacillus rossius redtenbacheri]|uniref:uncharacterized protein LOC134527697 n=1 Tax=Bacillus rossius redtenbacheri TaxID=93214 RepID=UPI002FDCD518